jgi:hypothetical protein
MDKKSRTNNMTDRYHQAMRERAEEKLDVILPNSQLAHG